MPYSFTAPLIKHAMKMKIPLRKILLWLTIHTYNAQCVVKNKNASPIDEDGAAQLALLDLGHLVTAFPKLKVKKRTKNKTNSDFYRWV